MSSGRTIAHAWPVIARGKGTVELHLLQRVVLAVRVDDQHGGAVVGAHQLLQDDARQVALARAGAGDDRQVGAGEAAHVQHDGHAPGGRLSSEPMCTAPAARPRRAQHLSQHRPRGDVDRRAGARRHARVDEAQRGS